MAYGVTGNTPACRQAGLIKIRLIPVEVLRYYLEIFHQ